MDIPVVEKESTQNEIVDLDAEEDLPSKSNKGEWKESV